jgi:thiol-disulfide isomerase/thioredoxin
MRLLIFVCILFVAGSGCSKSDNQLTANISGIGNDTIYVEWYNLDKPIGSTAPSRDTILAEQDQFTYTVNQKSPVLAIFSPLKGTIRGSDGRVIIRTETSLQLLLSPDTDTKVSGKLNPEFLEYHASGGTFNEDLSKLRNSLREISVSLFQNELQLENAIGQNKDTKSYFAKRRKLREQERARQLSWIRANPDKTLSAFLIFQQNLDTLGKYHDWLSEDVLNGYFKPTLDSEFERYLKFTAVRHAQQVVVKGMPAPKFTLQHQDGSAYSLFDGTEDKYVVLDFWGSWCAPCIKGIPDMKKYYDKYHDQLEIIGIACNDQDRNWRNAIEKYELHWTHVKNNDQDVTEDVSVRYGVSAFPTKVIIDPDGIIQGYFSGEGDDFYKALDEIFG